MAFGAASEGFIGALVHRTSDSQMDGEEAAPTKSGKVAVPRDKPVEQALEDAEPAIKDLFAAVRTFIMALGDDVQEKRVKLYMVYRRIKNFTCVVVQKKALVLYLKLNPTTVPLEEGFTRDVREIGHWGTGDLEVTLRTMADLKRAEPLIAKSYEGS